MFKIFGAQALEVDEVDEFDVEDGQALGTQPVLPDQLPSRRVLPGLRIKGETFSEFVDYRNVEFTGKVNLRDVKFEKGFSFAGSTFASTFRLTKVTNSQAGGSTAEFKGATFSGSVIAKDCSLYRADFCSTRFQQIVKFGGTRFYAACRFEDADFALSANFGNVLFAGIASFKGSKFHGACDFNGASFRYRSSHARFANCHFEGHAEFNGVRCAGDADFTECVFQTGVSFHSAQFSLLRAGEQDDGSVSADAGDIAVTFDRATFRGDPSDRENVSFQGARFGDQSLRREVSFRGALFRSNLQFNEGRYTSDFTDIECHGPISFDLADFES